MAWRWHGMPAGQRQVREVHARNQQQRDEHERRHQWVGTAGICSRKPHAAAPPGRRSRRRRSWALKATAIVEALIISAPAAGGSTKPIGASTPAASGIAMTL